MIGEGEPGEDINWQDFLLHRSNLGYIEFNTGPPITFSEADEVVIDNVLYKLHCVAERFNLCNNRFKDAIDVSDRFGFAHRNQMRQFGNATNGFIMLLRAVLDGDRIARNDLYYGGNQIIRELEKLAVFSKDDKLKHYHSGAIMPAQETELAKRKLYDELDETLMENIKKPSLAESLADIRKRLIKADIAPEFKHTIVAGFGESQDSPSFPDSAEGPRERIGFRFPDAQSTSNASGKQRRRENRSIGFGRWS